VPAQEERALVVGLQLTGRTRSNRAPKESEADVSESLEELAVLAESAGATVLERMTQARPAQDPATLVGSGKVSEIASHIEAHSIDTVIFDHELTPTQLRNLERRLPVKHIHVNKVTLDILHRRAHTSEGQ